MSKKLTKEEFIKKSKEKHGDKYDYSNVEYINVHTKVCIKCPEHGEFEQEANTHLQGHGCPKCYADKTRKRLTSTTEIFIKKARKVHKNKYDYSKVHYVNAITKVTIRCPEHGEFEQAPSKHLSGHNCPKCSGRYVPTTKEWIASARDVHNGKYDYSKVKYVNSTTKVCIICSEHGEFEQTPSDHIRGCGCPKCSVENHSGKQASTKEEFIKKACEKHKGIYDYSNVEYVNNRTKVCIICPNPDHGEFWQRPYCHLQGNGCPRCANEANGKRKRLSLSDFIKKARKVHCNKYDYSNAHYVDAFTKITIRCPKHGNFEQTPHDHAKGAGCPKCNLSHLERSVMNYLDEHGIIYDYQKRFDWLGRQSLDFYLPDYNVGIECQGEQHFFPVDFRCKGVEWACKEFDKIISRDKRKKTLCEKHGIKLLYFGNVPNYDTFLGEVVHDNVQYLIDYLK